MGFAALQQPSMHGSCCDAAERPACAHACTLATRSRPALQTGSGLRLRVLRRRARRKAARQADGFCVHASDSEQIPAYPVRTTLPVAARRQHRKSSGAPHPVSQEHTRRALSACSERPHRKSSGTPHPLSQEHRPRALSAWSERSGAAGGRVRRRSQRTVLVAPSGGGACSFAGSRRASACKLLLSREARWPF